MEEAFVEEEEAVLEGDLEVRAVAVVAPLERDVVVEDLGGEVIAELPLLVSPEDVADAAAVELPTTEEVEEDDDDDDDEGTAFFDFPEGDCEESAVDALLLRMIFAAKPALLAVEEVDVFEAEAFVVASTSISLSLFHGDSEILLLTRL